MPNPSAIFIDPRSPRPAPTLPIFLFRPLSVPSGVEVIDLSIDEWTEIVPPAHVIAAAKGGA